MAWIKAKQGKKEELVEFFQWYGEVDEETESDRPCIGFTPNEEALAEYKVM